MTLDDVKRLFHATPTEFAPYLEYAYHLQYGDDRDVTLAAEKLEPVVRAAVYAPQSVLPQTVVTAASKVFYHADVDVDLYMKGLLWRRFLAFMGVRGSESVQGRLAYYQSIERRQSNTLTPIKIRRFLTKYDVFNEWGDRQSEMQEIFSCYLDNAWGKTDRLDVRTLDHDDVDGWDDAFNKIRSCMSRGSEHGVGVHNSYLCYMTKYHGLDDNDVRLTVLYQRGKPVARTLTYTVDGDLYYVRNYGDDRLVRWLADNGYEHAGTLPLGTLLYTTERLIKPYVDGDIHYADHCTTNDGKHYWVLASRGEYYLQTPSAYAAARIECECCGDSYPEEDTNALISAVNGRWYRACETCTVNFSHYVYTGGQYPERLFFPDGCSPDTKRGYVEYDEEYYATDSLGKYDLCLVDGEVYPRLKST